MQDLIEARLNRLRQIAQGLNPDQLPETELEVVFGSELDLSLSRELNEERELVEEIWGQISYFQLETN